MSFNLFSYYYHYILLIISLLVNNTHLEAQNIHTLSDTLKNYQVGQYIDFIQDDLKSITINDILKNKVRFQKNTQKSPNFGHHNANYWFRIEITTTKNNNDWLLHIARALLEDIEVYQFNTKQELLAHYKMGTRYPFEQRPLQSQNFLIPLHLQKEKTTTLYIHFKGNNSKQFPMEIGEAKYLTHKLQIEANYTWIICTILFSLAIYNSFLFISIRKKTYLYYVFYMCFITLALFSFNGLHYQYLIPNSPIIAKIAFNILISFAAFFGLKFALHYLATHYFFPKYYTLLNYLGYAFLVNVLYILWVTYQAKEYYLVSLITTNIVGITFSLIAFFLGLITLFIKKFRPARFYVLAWTALLISAFLTALRQIGLLEDSFFTVYSFQIAAALEALLLSLGLADRINIIRIDRDKAQKEAIRLLQKNEKMIQEQNQILEQKVHERTTELQLTNEELVVTLETIARQRDDILASIEYAQRIQQALLPDKKEMQQILPNFMLLFMPKDIVSGDFYWFTKYNENEIFIAVADCTGHGVPGAFMTVIGENLLDQIINRDQINSPAQILTELDKRLLDTLNQQTLRMHKVDDGMDIILLKINLNEKSMTWAGAKRPIWILEPTNEDIIQIRGDKFPIGSTQYRNKKYTEQTKQLAANEVVYLFTDGYADQFGHNGKFTLRRFKNLLKEIFQKDFEIQENLLKQNLYQWQDYEKQTDDILIMAFKL